jgi:hypothetical protein
MAAATMLTTVPRTFSARLSAGTLTHDAIRIPAQSSEGRTGTLVKIERVM